MDENKDGEEQFYLTNPNWRNLATDDYVNLPDGTLVKEKEIYLAIEKLTPLLLRKYDRYPNIEDIKNFIFITISGG